MFTYPEINPIALTIGPLEVRWYGLMYLISFIAIWRLAIWRAQKFPNLQWNKTQIEDLIFFGALGVILGGRIGYMLFYNFQEWLHHPLSLFAIWQGGMSFHGGLIAVILSLFWLAHRQQRRFVDVADFIAPFIPLGLACGRIGNFINGELWGRITDVSWAMIFPHVDQLPRHPSQLYEFFIEGILLFIIMNIYATKQRPPFAVASLFLLGYGCFRVFCEQFREPDGDLGFLVGHWLTMGQLLSWPMIGTGLLGLIWAYRKSIRLCANI